MDFRIAWHLFRTDVRRLRWLIALVLTLMLWEASQYWLATPWDVPGLTGSMSSPRPGGNPEPVHGALFGLAALFFSAMTGWQGLTARILRPVTRREIVVGKLLVLSVVLWLPQSLAILIVLRHFGLGFPGALAGLASAAAVFVPLSLFLAAWGRLAGSFWRFLAALAVTAAVLSLALVPLSGHANPFGAVNFLWLLLDPWGQNASPMVWALSGGCAVTLGLLVLTIRRWSALLRRTAAGAAIVLITFLILRSAALLQADPVPRAPQMDLTAIRPDISGPMDAPGQIASWCPQPVGLRGTVVSKGLPEGLFCDWQLTGPVVLTGQSGSRVTSFAIPGRVQENGWSIISRFSAANPQLRAAAEAGLTSSLRRNLGAAEYLNDEAPAGRLPWGSERSILATFTSDLTVLGEKNITLTTSCSGLVYRYRILADLPLTAGAEAAAHGGRLLVRTVPDASDGGYVELALLMPVTGTGKDIFMQSVSILPASMWRAFLYFPDTNEIFNSTACPLNVAGPILGGGVNHRVMYRFRDGIHPLPAGNPDAATPRVIILEPEIIGRIHRELHTSGLSLDVPPTRERPAAPAKKSAPDNKQFRNISTLWPFSFGPKLSPPDVLAWARTHRPDPATASPEEFGRWMQFCLGQFFPTNWLAGELERWVPTQLPEMIRMGRFAESAFNTAFIRALPEDRKEEVIARLEDAPWLLETIVARGWLEEARAQLLRLFEAGKLRTYHDLACVAALRAPETYERLIAQCDRPDAEALYLALRSIPGIEPGLTDRIQQSPWLAGIPADLKNGRPRYPYGDIRRLHIRLSHGIPEAAKDAILLHHRLTDELPGTNGDQEFMEQHFALPDGVKRGSAESGAWLRQLNADDVHWDPLTRLWRAGNLQP